MRETRAPSGYSHTGSEDRQRDKGSELFLLSSVVREIKRRWRRGREMEKKEEVRNNRERERGEEERVCHYRIRFNHTEDVH